MPLTAHSPANTKTMPSHLAGEGCSFKSHQASSTATTGTPRLDKLATAVDTRLSTIDHNHHARPDASNTL